MSSSRSTISNSISKHNLKPLAYIYLLCFSSSSHRSQLSKVMMLSTSKLKQKERSWLDLPYDVMINILNRIGMVDIIENAEKVCTAWLKICMDPSLWRVVNMNDLSSSVIDHSSKNLCRLAVNRSQGQLVDVTLVNAYDGSTLLGYVSERSSQLRRLEMAYHYIGVSLSEALIKFSLLEELNLYFKKISKQEIETVGHYCPMLKTLKVNDKTSLMCNDEIAIAIGQNLPELRHLELIGNGMTNIGLQVILDNCLRLETLDLRACVVNLDLNGDIGKQCSKKVKYLKLPSDSLEGFPYVLRSYNEASDDDDDYYYYGYYSPEIFDGYISQ